MFGVACVLSPLRKALAQTSEVWARSRPQTSNAILFRCGRCLVVTSYDELSILT